MALWVYTREQSLKQSGLINPNPLQTSPCIVLLGFFSPQENKLFSILTNCSIFSAGHPSVSWPHAKVPWLLQQRARTAAYVFQHQHHLCTSHPRAGISATTSSPERESFTYSCPYMFFLMSFFVCLFFVFPFFCCGVIEVPHHPAGASQPWLYLSQP